MYIIDFGLSTMKINNKWVNRMSTTYHYRKTYEFNSSQDLRMLFTCMLYKSIGTPLKKDFFKYLYQIEKPILNYYDIEAGNLWWDTYKELIPYYDSNFTPKSVIKYMDKIIKKEDVGTLPAPTIKVLRHGSKLPKKPYSNGTLHSELEYLKRRLN